MSRSIPRPTQRVKSDESRPHRGGLGPPNHIKESIKIKPRAQCCHITSRDVTFNAEILKYGRDILRAQFKQGQPPEYALTLFPWVCGGKVGKRLRLQKEGITERNKTSTCFAMDLFCMIFPTSRLTYSRLYKNKKINNLLKSIMINFLPAYVAWKNKETSGQLMFVCSNLIPCSSSAFSNE
jgi:hypothetical protein